MRKNNFLLLTTMVFLLAGCGWGEWVDEGVVCNCPPVYFSKVVVERGPVLHAFVFDSNGQLASETGDGEYEFSQYPAFPVTAAGGFIDLNRDGVVSEEDIKNTVVLKSSWGYVVTVASTIASNSEVHAWLEEQFELTDVAIDYATPSDDKTIAAISDEVYAYCIENNLSDPSALSLEQLQEELSTRIQKRIQYYQESNLTVAELEQQLVTELGISRLSNEEIADIQRNGEDIRALLSLIEVLPAVELNDAQKQSMAYMWNEEKLAKDIYLALNELIPHNTLYNIATRSETQHQKAVEALVKKYDLNINNPDDYRGGYSADALSAIAPGVYNISAIQELYDTLYAKGSRSLRDALKVGCIVESTDIQDLDKDIEIAAGTPDIVLVYSILRSGSYNHYWAFDRALKRTGVNDGCCSLGENYCKIPENN